MPSHRSKVAIRFLPLVAGAAAVLVGLAAAAEEHHPPSDAAKDMPGAEGTFDFKPTDWTGAGTTSWWLDSDGVDPGKPGCHIGASEDGKPNGRMFGEACTAEGLLVESNPGAGELHKHSDDTGHPDLFDCEDWCEGTGHKGGSCVAAEAPPCAASAKCSCN
jgi:hypothetical protein